MKKVIELLEEAKRYIGKSFYAHGPGFGHYEAVYCVKKAEGLVGDALVELSKPPRWETPKQYRERTGREYPDSAAVRVFNLPEDEWELMEYWRAKQLKQDLARLDKDFGYEPEGLPIICDRSDVGPPPKGWKPEV